MDGRSESMVIFSGPHAYISPSWYVSTRPSVPTWNYAVVHASGRPAARAEAPFLRAVVEELTKRNEAHRDRPWTTDRLPADSYDKMLGAIVGFEMRVERCEAKFKLGQNRPGRRPRGRSGRPRRRAVGSLSRCRRVHASLWRSKRVIVRRAAACVCLIVATATLSSAQHTLATRDFFYVGGAYAGEKSTEVMGGQMYVEVLRPQRVTKRYPLRLLPRRRTDGDELDQHAGRPSRVGRLFSRSRLRRLPRRSTRPRAVGMEAVDQRTATGRSGRRGRIAVHGA